MVNIVVAQELVYKIRKHKGKGSGLMLMKIDIKKTYDRLEWKFINAALEAWGFLDAFRNLISSCLNSVHYNILINRSIAENFSPS